MTDKDKEIKEFKSISIQGSISHQWLMKRVPLLFPHTRLPFWCALQRHSFISEFLLDWTRPGPFCFFIDCCFLFPTSFFFCLLSPSHSLILTLFLILLSLALFFFYFFLPLQKKNVKHVWSSNRLKRHCCQRPLQVLFCFKWKEGNKHLINNNRCWTLCMDYRNAWMMCESSKTPLLSLGCFHTSQLGDAEDRKLVFVSVCAGLSCNTTLSVQTDM